jgi:pyruvate/2-oxoacid:ferredoxin oxidoreductase alpha subunit
MAKGAVRALRQEGIKAGLFRPQSLWPFPIKLLRPLHDHAVRLVVVEASNGQLEDELRLALSRAGIVASPPIHNVRHFGGVLPQQDEIVERTRACLVHAGAPS